MTPRRAARVDGNQADIDAVLRAAGYTIIPTTGMGDGFPDRVIIRRGRVYLVEVKAAHGRLTPNEVRFIVKLVDPCYRIFDSIEQTLAFLGTEEMEY